MDKKYEDKKGNSFATYQEAIASNQGVNPSIPSIPKISPSINAGTIGSATPIKLPETPIPTSTPEYTLPDVTSELDKETAKIKAEKAASESTLASLISEIGGVTGNEATYATQAGADVAQKEYDQYSSQIEAEKLASRRQIENIQKNNPTGALRGGQLDLISNIERDSLSKQLDLAMSAELAKGRADRAMSIAKRKVASELAPLQAKYDAQKFIYDNNKDLFSKAELTKLDGLIKANERKITDEEDRLTKGNEMIIEALSFKAPQNIIDQAKEALKNGSSPMEIANIIGKFSGATANAELLRAKIDTEKAQAEKARAESGTVNKKPLSGEASKLLAISNGLEKDVSDIKARIDKLGYKQFLQGYLIGTDRETVKLIARAADKVGRIRSGGAINKDEETRFVGQFASGGDYAFGNKDEAVSSLDSILTEAQTVRSGIDPNGAYSPQKSVEDTYIETVIGAKDTIENPVTNSSSYAQDIYNGLKKKK